MNKKIKLPLLLSIMITFVLIVGITMKSMKVAKAEEIKKVTYSQKSYFDYKEDGWVYNFEIDYPNDDGKIVYMFDGYNLKYKELEGYYVPVIEKGTGKILDKIIPEYITLSISEDYREDIVKIVNFFNQEQFDKEINLSDLEDLQLEKIDKSYLVYIFNKTLNADLKTEPGEYYNSSVLGKVNVISSDENMPGEWQAIYILDYGNVEKVNVEFIDKSGNYVLNDESTSSKYKEFYNQSIAVENDLTNNNIKSTKTTLTKNYNKDLILLMEKLTEELTNSLEE